MNNVSSELLKQFIQCVLDDDCGINQEAYKLLTQLLINDKNLASVLHDTIEMCEKNSNGRYVINPN
jgi:hypothetical protein